LRQEFDELFSARTGYTALDDRIAKTEAKKDELLTVLSVPSVPLQNNGSECKIIGRWKTNNKSRFISPEGTILTEPWAKQGEFHERCRCPGL
jgi:hypothetical protein